MSNYLFGSSTVNMSMSLVDDQNFHSLSHAITTGIRRTIVSHRIYRAVLMKVLE